MIVIAFVTWYLMPVRRRRPGRHTRIVMARRRAAQWDALDREWAAALAECAARQDARRPYMAVA
jgi:hypothetical protein